MYSSVYNPFSIPLKETRINPIPSLVNIIYSMYYNISMFINAMQSFHARLFYGLSCDNIMISNFINIQICFDLNVFNDLWTIYLVHTKYNTVYSISIYHTFNGISWFISIGYKFWQCMSILVHIMISIRSISTYVSIQLYLVQKSLYTDIDIKGL